MQRVRAASSIDVAGKFPETGFALRELHPAISNLRRPGLPVYLSLRVRAFISNPPWTRTSTPASRSGTSPLIARFGSAAEARVVIKRASTWHSHLRSVLCLGHDVGDESGLRPGRWGLYRLRTRAKRGTLGRDRQNRSRDPCTEDSCNLIADGLWGSSALLT